MLDEAEKSILELFVWDKINKSIKKSNYSIVAKSSWSQDLKENTCD